MSGAGVGTAGPLAGLRVLEVGHILAGPYATMLLADLGAEVTKLEPPGGDLSRQVSDAYFASLNRGKRSLVADLATPTGQERLHAFVADADALLVNLKPSAVRRFGLTYEALKEWNPHLVCVVLTGWGMDGSDEPAFDYVVQAVTGVASLTGEPEGPPQLPGYSAADNSAGLTAALALLAQVHSGRGGQLEVSLRDVMLSQLNYRASAWLNEGREPQRLPGGAHSFYVPAQLFPTAEGHLALFLTHDTFWAAFTREADLDAPEFATLSARASHRDEVVAAVTKALAADTARGWETRLRALHLPAAAVRTLPEALADAPETVVEAGGFRLVGSPIRIPGHRPAHGPPPALGEHG